MPLKYQVSTFHWLQADTETRSQISKLLDLPRTGGGKVYGTRLISDGYTNEDLAGITVERINSLLQSSYAPEHILEAFEALVNYVKRGTGADQASNAESKEDSGQSSQPISPDSKKGNTSLNSSREDEQSSGTDASAGSSEVSIDGKSKYRKSTKVS